MSIISVKKEKLFGVVIFKEDQKAEVVPLSWFKNGKCFFPIDAANICDSKAKVKAMEKPNDNYRLREASLSYETCMFIKTLLF